MPIYAYKCASCGHAQDVLQKVSDALLTQCPQCGAATFSKQVTAAGFQLRGSGWYATDFKNGSSKRDGDNATESKTPASGDGGSAPDSSSKAEKASSGASGSCGHGGCSACS